MWWPSFCAVLSDLWRFAWGIDTRTSTFAPASVSRPVPEQVAAHIWEEQAKKEALVRLVPNIRYTADHEKTQAIRAYLTEHTTIQDTTGDLIAYEWIVYLFTWRGRSLPWATLALAPIGHWHQSLKGLPHVTVGVTPRTHALMEWRDSNQHGHIGYLTKVTPEETVTVQELGDELPGVLHEYVWRHEEWKELRPVFISVT